MVRVLVTPAAVGVTSVGENAAVVPEGRVDESMARLTSDANPFLDLTVTV
jgi:hypothetical protein